MRLEIGRTNGGVPICNLALFPGAFGDHQLDFSPNLSLTDANGWARRRFLNSATRKKRNFPLAHSSGLTFISTAKSRRALAAVARKPSIAVRALLMSVITLDLLNGWSGS